MLLKPHSLDEIKQALSIDHVNLIFIGEKAEVNIEDLIDYANTRGIKLAGAIFPAVTSNETHHEDGVILRKLPKKSEIRLYKDLNHSVDVQFPSFHGHVNSALLFVDGLMDNISGFLEKVYEHYWDEIKFIGGGCGSLSLQQKPCVFTNKGIFQDAAFMIFLKETLSLGVNHGWKKIAGPFVVSAADGNTILELNWRPAFDVYKEVVEEQSGKVFSKDNFFDIAKGYPFGIYREGMEDVVRDPIFQNGNGLVCVGEVHDNAMVNILSGNLDDLVNGAENAANEALKSGKADSVILVDCISRVLFQEKSFEKELKTVLDSVHQVNEKVEVEGVLSLGEISSYGNGYLEFFNKTIVVGAFQSV